MLKFNKVEATNYKSFGELSLDLQNKGLTLIEGSNTDNDAFESNGSGKSTALETITYALYDTTANKVRADEVVNRKVGKDTSVKLHFEQDGVPYRVERYRKHSEHKNKVRLFQNDKDITGSTNRVTNEMIEDIVGISLETYLNSVMYGQGTEPLFSEATDKGKKEILENITSISIYASAQEIAREKVKEQQLAESSIEAEELQIKNNIGNIKDSVEREKERYKSIKEMIDSREKAYEEAKAERKQFPQTNLRSLINKLKKIDKPFPEFQEDLTHVNKFRKDLEDIEGKSQAFMQAINQLVAQRDNKLQEQARLDTADVCPTCGTELSNEHALMHHNELQAEIDVLQENIANYTKQYEAVFQPQIESIKGDLRFAEIDVETRRQEHNDERYKMQTEVQQVTSQIQIYENEKEQLVRDVDNAKKALEEVKSLPKPDERKDEIGALEKELESLKDKRDNVFIAKTQYEDAVKAFSNQGIRSVVLDLVTPTLTNSANRYLNTLSESTLQVEFTTQVENSSGELADRFDVLVTHNGEQTTFQTLSQGEKTRVNVAISLALQDLVYSNSQLKTNIALYDEVFDGLDDTGITSVIEILKEKAEEIGSVFVITHSSTMKPLFENVITVEKTAGMSRIEEE